MKITLTNEMLQAMEEKYNEIAMLYKEHYNAWYENEYKKYDPDEAEYHYKLFHDYGERLQGMTDLLHTISYTFIEDKQNKDHWKIAII